MTGHQLRALTSRLLLIASALVAAASLGCTEEELKEIIADPTQLELRQAALAAVAAGTYDLDNPPPTTDEDCTTTLEAGSDPNGDAQMLNDAVENASSWDVICLAPGTYQMGDADGNANGTVFVSAVANLTVKGIGATPDDVLLDYAEQADDRGFDVTTPGFWIERFSTAIMGTRACGLRAQIRDQIDGRLVRDAENPDEIAATLHEMLDLPGKRDYWSRNAQRRVHDESLVFTQVRDWLRVLSAREKARHEPRRKPRPPKK